MRSPVFASLLLITVFSFSACASAGSQRSTQTDAIDELEWKVVDVSSSYEISVDTSRILRTGEDQYEAWVKTHHQFLIPRNEPVKTEVVRQEIDCGAMRTRDLVYRSYGPQGALIEWSREPRPVWTSMVDHSRLATICDQARASSR